MLETQTRLSNLALQRRSEVAYGHAAGASMQPEVAAELLERHSKARDLIMGKIKDGYGARRLELPATVWIASSPIEAADMLRRPGVEVVLMPVGQALFDYSQTLAAQLPTLDPDRGISTSWSLNHRIQGDQRTMIIDAEPLFTRSVVGGSCYADPQNKALISSALGLLAVCQLAHPESNDWQLALTREDHTTARKPHIHRGEISAVLGAVGSGVQLKDKIVVDGLFTDLFVPQSVAAFFKGPRQFLGSKVFGRAGVLHQTPKPDNSIFPYEQRLAVVCYANSKGETAPEPAPEVTANNYLEIYTRHLSNWLFKFSFDEITKTAKSFINLE